MTRSMTGPMTKVAPSWRKTAMGVAMVLGMAGSAPARAFAPVHTASPKQPAEATTPAPAATAPVAQPGYPPAATPSAAPAAPSGPPPQYPPPPPGYPQETAAPPTGEQEAYPPAGYPQQYPPAYPQGYPQQYPPGYPQQYPQQGYPQQYPPSSYPQPPYGQPGYPPPGYYPPNYPPPPLPPPPSTRPHGHGALLLLPYLGVQANEGATGSQQNAGFRMGGLIGYRSNGQFSFNAELTIDVLNLKNAPAGVDLSGAGVDLAFSPLFHFDAGTLELAIGPKIGFGDTIVEAKDDFGASTQSSTAGFIYGVNAGAFLPLGNGASLGALLSFEVRTVSESCQKFDGGSETCVDVSDANSDKILGVTGAALF